MNKLSYSIAVVMALVLVAYLFSLRDAREAQPATTESVYGSDYKSIAYALDGEVVMLKNGVAETDAAPGSASKIVTRYFGNEAQGDLNGDGRLDRAFLLTQDRGGTGTFFYLVGAVLEPDGRYRGTSGVFLGDRIAPQTTEIRDGKVIVNYAVRKEGASMSESPSEGRSIHLKLDPGSDAFGEVVQNFEGEADPSRMNLQMKTWYWIEATFNDGREISPKEESKFTATFKDGRFFATTDCNDISSSYETTGDTIHFGPIAMTKKFCEGSLEADFVQLFEMSDRFHFTSRGEMILSLKSGSGTAVFR